MSFRCGGETVVKRGPGIILRERERGRATPGFYERRPPRVKIRLQRLSPVMRAFDDEPKRIRGRNRSTGYRDASQTTTATKQPISNCLPGHRAYSRAGSAINLATDEYQTYPPPRIYSPRTTDTAKRLSGNRAIVIREL